MKVLVTGGRGFIGRAVCAEIERAGHKAIMFDRPRWDVRSAEDLAKVDIDTDAVIHMAGVLGTHELFDSIDEAIDTNIKGTARVLEWCRDREARYVGITMPPVFPSVYTATKMAATRLASAFHNSYGVPVSHVRAFNAFGPGQAHGPGHPQKIVPTFAVAAWRGEPLPIWGDGLQGVDLIHTQDLARMLVEALAHGDNATFDGGTGKMWTVLSVAVLINDIVQEHGGPGGRLVFLPMRRGEVPTRIVADGEGWERLMEVPTFRMRDLIDTVLSYKP